ncbi:MAG: hypothetical protein Q4E64_04815 [Phascolarctobacterium sp.]|nr:hypothetical protein [Phascolarctobacterium sp.]
MALEKLNPFKATPSLTFIIALLLLTGFPNIVFAFTLVTAPFTLTKKLRIAPSSFSATKISESTPFKFNTALSVLITLPQRVPSLMLPVNVISAFSPELHKTA